jgi:hypothetical protein
VLTLISAMTVSAPICVAVGQRMLTIDAEDAEMKRQIADLVAPAPS